MYSFDLDFDIRFAQQAEIQIIKKTTTAMLRAMFRGTDSVGNGDGAFYEN